MSRRFGNLEVAFMPATLPAFTYRPFADASSLRRFYDLPSAKQPLYVRPGLPQKANLPAAVTQIELRGLPPRSWAIDRNQGLSQSGGNQ